MYALNILQFCNYISIKLKGEKKVCMRTQQEDSHLQARERDLKENKPCRCLEFELPDSRTVQNTFLFNPSSLVFCYVILMN